MINFCIIHYNTPDLTKALVQSINKLVNDAHIYIFDNSDSNPFINTFSNVTIFDNTHGQIINFDEWLKQFPTRLTSSDISHKSISAKHAISVQKCIELINDNFILADSDILLIKDISDIIDETCIYVASHERIIWTPNVWRVVPYLCYINVNMCKQYNITYFNDKFMHGLNTTKECDKYDTGAYFLLATKNIKHKEINIYEYIIHYKGGSWEKLHNEYKHRNLKSSDWLKENKQYYE